MADYKQMYLTLFRKVTKAIALLQEAQIEAEEMFMLSDKPTMQIVSSPSAGTIPASDENND